MKSKSQIRNWTNSETKGQARKIKRQATRKTTKIKKLSSHTTRRKPHEKRFRGDENKLKEAHARDNKNKHHNEGESQAKSL